MEEEEAMQWTPMSLFEKLNETVIGQDDYLRSLCTTVWLHDARIRGFNQSQRQNYSEKQNLLIVGPTGSGKTLAMQAVTNLLGYDLLIVNGPDFTGNGWKGRDAEEMITDLYRECHKDKKRTEQGIIVIDEIDKVMKKASEYSDSSSFDVQNSLLKLIEGMEIAIKNKDDQVVEVINTANILFVAGGAFEGIERIIQKRIHGVKTVGFGGNTWKQEDEKDLLLQVKKKDLLEYGVGAQFLGRFSRLAALRELNANDIKKILIHSKASPVKTMDHLLYDSLGIHVTIDEAGAEAIAKQVVKEKTGVRTATFLIQEVMEDVLFLLPNKENVKALSIFEKDGEPAIKYIQGQPKRRQKLRADTPLSFSVKDEKHVERYVDYVLNAGGVVVSSCNLREVRALHLLVSAIVLYTMGACSEKDWNTSSIQKILETEKNGSWNPYEETVCELLLVSDGRDTEYYKRYQQYKGLRTNKRIIDLAIAACEQFECNPNYEMRCVC